MGLGQLQTDLWGFDFAIYPPEFFKLVKLISQSTFFVNFASRNLSRALHMTTL